MLKKLSLLTAIIGVSLGVARADTFKAVQASTSGAPQAGMAGYAVNLPSATFTTLISTQARGSFTQMSNHGKTVYDNFNRSNRALSQDHTPTGDLWTLSGVGVSTAQIQNGIVVSTRNYYADIDYGSQIPKICGAFSFVPSSNPVTEDKTVTTLAMHMDTTQIGLSTMLHLNYGLSSWGLNLYVSGVANLVAQGSYNLAEDGTIYGICMEVNGASVTVRPPQGSAVTYSSATIASTTYRYGTWQYTATDATPVGRWHGILMDNINSMSDVDRALGMGVSANANVFSTVNESSATISDARISSLTVSNLLALNATTVTGSLISGSSTGMKIKGTTSNNNASPGDYGEYFSSNTNITVNAASTGNYGNYLSTTVAAGDWEVSGGLEIDSNGAVVSLKACAISVNSGNTTTDQILGLNNMSTSGIFTTSDVYGCVIPTNRISVNTTTTIYLKFRCNYTGGPPTAFAGSIQAVRAR